MQGYRRKNPDVSWWVEQIRAGEKWRDDVTHRNRWDVWRKYYRGDFAKNILPKNIFFMMTRTIVPRIYFRNPSVSIQPCKPGPAHAVLARILERVDNTILGMMKMKGSMKMLAQTTFHFGTGIGTLGFGALHTPTPDLGVTAPPLTREGANLEYRQGMLPNMPWFLPTPLEAFVVPAGIRSFEEAFFNAIWTARPVEEVKKDSRFKNTKDIKSTGNHMSYRQTDMGDIYTPIDMVNLCQIRDYRTGRVFVIAPDVSQKVLLDTEDDMQYNNGGPHYPIVFNQDDERPYGVADSKILEPIQLEINETKTLTMKHRRLALIKIFVKSGMLKPEAAQRMVSSDVAAVVETEGDPMTDLRMAEVAPIPQDLLLHEQSLMNDVREVTGFGRNQFGEFSQGSARHTAFEANVVQMASEIRIDERRDMLADMLVNVINHIHNIIFKHWTQEQVIDIIGPMGVPMWVKFTGQMLKAGAYEVKVDPDTSLPQTKQLREQRATEFFKLASQYPTFDPYKLSSLLLHEHYGVQYDDLLQGAPMAGLMGPVDMQTAMQMWQQMQEQSRQMLGSVRRQTPQLMQATQQLTQQAADVGGGSPDLTQIRRRRR